MVPGSYVCSIIRDEIAKFQFGVRLPLFRRSSYVQNISIHLSWHQQMKIRVKENSIMEISEHFFAQRQQRNYS